jgi:hypothetical protein
MVRKEEGKRSYPCGGMGAVGLLECNTNASNRVSLLRLLTVGVRSRKNSYTPIAHDLFYAVVR